MITIHHMLTLTENHFYCPKCGREFILIIDPYHREIIEEGDNSAIHAGGLVNMTANIETDNHFHY